MLRSDSSTDRNDWRLVGCRRSCENGHQVSNEVAKDLRKRHTEIIDAKFRKSGKTASRCQGLLRHKEIDILHANRYERATREGRAAVLALKIGADVATITRSSEARSQTLILFLAGGLHSLRG